MSSTKVPRSPIGLGVLLVGLAILLVGVCLGGALLFQSRLSSTGAPSPTVAPPIVSASTLAVTPSSTPSATATSAPTDTPTALPTVELGTSNVFIEYILDASGSMTETLSDGSAKIDVAKQVLTDHMRSFRPETNIGLRAYGHRLPYQQTAESCKDIELVAPVAKGQMERIVGFLHDFKAQGMTPLAASLQQAKEDFTFDASRVNSIVLLSDGIETCSGDPCQLVEDLKAQGINFTIHVIGLDVDGPTKEQLSCIAKAGGGTYHDANTERDLGTALDAVQTNVTKDEVIVPAGQDTPTPVPATPTPVPTPTTPAGALSGKIVFLSSRDYSDYRSDMGSVLWPHDIYMMNPDGSDQTRITEGLRLINMNSPVVSPDGSQIAIGGYTRGGGIRILDSDGTVVSEPGAVEEAAWVNDWSGSGDLLLSVFGPNFSEEIYSLDLQTGQSTRLTNDTRRNLFASWSPDGQRIAFMSDYELWIMDADGSDQRRLIDGEARDVTWSPDGTKIAFESQDVPARSIDYDLWIVNADGTGKQRVTNTPGFELYNPAWSPDGTKLAFVGYPDGSNREGQIFIVDIASGEMTQLTHAGNNFELFWVNGKQ